MPAPTSFFCEHTAGYCLADRIRCVLEPQFRSVLPLYYWATREGNSMSRDTGGMAEGHLVAVFPRRVKVSTAAPDQVRVKVNSSVFDYAEHADLVGLPVLTGAPLVRCALDLARNPTVIWWKLLSTTGPTCDVEVDMALDARDPTYRVAAPPSLQTIAQSDLPREFLRSNKRSWGEAIQCIDEVRRRTAPGGGPYRFFGAYKPFFVFATPS